MFEVVNKFKCPYILTHNIEGGINKNVMDESKNTIKELIKFFSNKISELNSLGIYDIIIDPGFGFSKNVKQNFEIIKNFELLDILNTPILAGVSRKSMIYKPLKKFCLSYFGTFFLRFRKNCFFTSHTHLNFNFFPHVVLTANELTQKKLNFLQKFCA